MEVTKEEELVAPCRVPGGFIMVAARDCPMLLAEMAGNTANRGPLPRCLCTVLLIAAAGWTATKKKKTEIWISHCP